MWLILKKKIIAHNEPISEQISDLFFDVKLLLKHVRKDVATKVLFS